MLFNFNASIGGKEGARHEVRNLNPLGMHNEDHTKCLGIGKTINYG